MALLSVETRYRAGNIETFRAPRRFAVLRAMFSAFVEAPTDILEG